MFSFSSTSASKQTHLFTVEEDGEETLLMCQQAFPHTSCLLLFLPLNSFGCYIRTHSMFSLLRFFPRPLGFYSDLVKRKSSVMLWTEINFSSPFFFFSYQHMNLTGLSGVLKGFYSCLRADQTHSVPFYLLRLILICRISRNKPQNGKISVKLKQNE